MIDIRSATIDDFHQLLTLGAQMVEESVVRFPDVDPDRVKQQLELSIEHPALMMCKVAEQDGTLIGMITAVLGDYAFAFEKRSACDLLFVTPDRRGAVAAKLLIKAFTDWSDELEAKSNVMGISTGVHPERTGLLFERMGFSPLGQSYRRDV